MNNLVDVLSEFWQAWFGLGSHDIDLDADIFSFIVITCVISLVYGVILRPLFSLFSR